MKSGYDYEKTYSQMMQRIEQEVLQSSVGDIPKNPNTKKTPNKFRENRYIKRTSFV